MGAFREAGGPLGCGVFLSLCYIASPLLSDCRIHSTIRIAGVSAFVSESLGVSFSLSDLSSDRWDLKTCHLPQDLSLLAYRRVVE
jgi:hypothetical protein